MTVGGVGVIYINNESGTVGVISHSELAQLPDQVRSGILETADTSKETEEGLEFFIEDDVAADRIYQEITYYQKQKLDTSMNLKRPPLIEQDTHNEQKPEASTENIALPENVDDLYYQSPGLYSEEDILELYEIQRGRCYYTGKPLTKAPANYVVDLIEPASEGGTCWPGNLALALKSASQAKSTDTKMKYFMQLQKEYGEDWYQKQRDFCKTVDQSRRDLDRRRKEAVTEFVSRMETRLRDANPELEIEYRLESGKPILIVNSACVDFPAGYIRNKKQFGSYSYLSRLVMALTG
jgi:hypothetical protein